MRQVTIQLPYGFIELVAKLNLLVSGEILLAAERNHFLEHLTLGCHTCRSQMFKTMHKFMTHLPQREVKERIMLMLKPTCKSEIPNSCLGRSTSVNWLLDPWLWSAQVVVSPSLGIFNQLLPDFVTGRKCTFVPKNPKAMPVK